MSLKGRAEVHVSKLRLLFVFPLPILDDEPGEYVILAISTE